VQHDQAGNRLGTIGCAAPAVDWGVTAGFGAPAPSVLCPNGVDTVEKSKIERLQKSRESRFLIVSTTASLCRTGTEVSVIAFVGIDVVPPRGGAWDALAVLKILFVTRKRLFQQYRS
jgi:hypothetical protein